MASKIEWFPDKWEYEIFSAARFFLDRTAALLTKATKKKLDRPFRVGTQDVRFHKGARVTTAQVRAGGRLAGAYRGTASKPGKPPKRDKGNLTKSIIDRVDDNKLWCRVGTTLKYGRALELGAGRQPITVRRKKFLRFWDKRSQQVVFTKAVMRGPIKPRPFLRPTLREQWRTIKRMWKRTYKK